MDGSVAALPPVELEGTNKPRILTLVRVVAPVDVERGSLEASCLRGRRRDLRPQGLIVERIGLTSESVTVTLHGQTGLYACDNSEGPREGNRRWCGSSFGQLYGGRLRDPRLDIGCMTKRGRQMGFIWIEPDEATRYVAVEQPAYSEVYAVAGGLPVRISTISGVDVMTSSAVFHVSEHDANGRVIQRYRLEAHVAG
jgi:hypothetical protein